MKSSEEMAKSVLRRFEEEATGRRSRREAWHKRIIRIISAACCLGILTGSFTLWQRLDRTPAAASPEANTPDTTQSSLPAETTASPEATVSTEPADPTLQTAPAETTEPTEPVRLSSPTDRQHQFALIQLVLEKGTVVRHLVLNGEGQSVLEELPLAGLTPEEAFPMLLKPLVEAGFIAGDPDSAPVLMLAAYDRNGYDKNGNLHEIVERDGLGAVISTFLADRGITQRILERDQTDTKYTQSLEQLYGASTEYFLPVLEQVRQARQEALSGSDLVVAELFTLDVTRDLIVPKYQIGDYDQYGELILYGPETETPAPGWSQEDVSPEIWETYVKIYTPEDLAMLMRPRIWTTMPNVVGMHENDAGALLRSREIVPRVIYEDNEEYRAMGFTDGQVFLQDCTPGKRVNSDASIFLWVMARTEPERNGLSQGWHPDGTEQDPTQSQNCIGEPEVNRQHAMEAWVGEFSEEKLKAAILAYPGEYSAFDGSVNMITFTVDFEPVSCSVARLAPVDGQDIIKELTGYIDLAAGCSIQGQKVLIDTGWWIDRTGDWTQNHSQWSYLVRLLDVNLEEHYYYFRVNYRK